MSLKNSTVLKGYFQTGMRPTQAQFGDLVDSLLAGTLNVKRDYGAAGDGVTDDSTAFANAIADARSNAVNGTIRVFIPAGTYLLQNLTFPANYPAFGPAGLTVEFIGAGPSHTILQQAAANTPIIKFSQISHGYVLGNFGLKPHASSATGKLIDCRGCLECTFDNIRFFDNGSAKVDVGFYLSSGADDTTLVHCYDNTFRRIRADWVTQPRAIFKLTTNGTAFPPNLNWFKNVSIISTNISGSVLANGFDIDGGTSIYIQDSHFEGITGNGIHNTAAGPNLITVSKCYFENCTTKGINSTADAYFVLDGCVFAGVTNIFTRTPTIIGATSGQALQVESIQFGPNNGGILTDDPNSIIIQTGLGSSGRDFRIYDSTGGSDVLKVAKGTRALSLPSGVSSLSSGSDTFLSLTPTVSQSGTAGYRGFLLNVTESTLGSGSKLLADLQVGGTSRISIDNVGTLNIASVSSGVRLFNTTDQTTNYERGSLRWSSNVFQMVYEAGGTGNPQVMELKNQRSDGTNTTFDISVNSLPFISATRSANTTGTGNLVQFSFGSGASSGTTVMLALTPTIAQGSTAGYTVLLINPTQSSTGSGAKLLADFQLGGTSKVSIDNGGIVNMQGNLQRAGTQILTTRQTGWTAATGTPTRTTFATSSVTLSVLAEHVKALIDDLITHGLIGT